MVLFTWKEGRGKNVKFPYQQGISTLEFAITLPIFFIFLGSIAAFGHVHYAQMALLNAVQAGVQYALINNPSDMSEVATFAHGVAALDLPAIATSDVVAEKNPIDICPTSPSCDCSGKPCTYVRVIASYTFITGAYVKDLIPASIPIQFSSTMRIK